LLAYRLGKTTILISHRPRIINRADWIAVLENGSLQLQSSIEDLRSQEGDHLNFLLPDIEFSYKLIERLDGAVGLRNKKQKF
jgi:ABC-type transport system involved in cytochrome bd biosynthesis fused ATPase/permease subunit